MSHGTSRISSHHMRQNVGTLWTMRRLDSSARCALFARAGGWELSVLVDGVSLLTEQCSRSSDAFNLAEKWKLRMLHQGWVQIVPREPPSDPIVDPRPL